MKHVGTIFLVTLLVAHAGAVASPTEQAASAPSAANDTDVARLVAALLGATPILDDLRQLTDEIGGRPTGSEANLASVDWALETFAEAGVTARSEAFTMPNRWLERSARATIRGERVHFSPRIASMPFSAATPAGGTTAPLVDAGRGRSEDFERLGEAARGAFVLVETDELADVPGLFAEYAAGAEIEGRAFAAGVAGVVYMGSRPRDVLYRHNLSQGPVEGHVGLVLERGAAGRALRLLRAGRPLTLEVAIELDAGGSYESYNVIGEIRGSESPESFVVIGAHLDSWGFGTGALDNGCNVTLVIDLARQIRRLGLVPRRTIRFALWNGEEQGMNGSWGYTKSHLNELDRHVMASSFDIGSGHITGFFTNGRSGLIDLLQDFLTPVAGLGPFVHDNHPIVGTDNFDFMLQGVPNLVANQDSANYGPNYHAGTDTFDKVDAKQLKLNAAIAAAVIWGFAQADLDLPRQSRREIEALVESTDLEQQMRMFGKWESWANGERGRSTAP